MNITTPRTPSGFNEYLPAEQIEFNRLLDIVRNTYEKYGFTPLDTPVLELSEVLLAKGGGETEKQVYRFERGRNDLTMRYDLTVPLARYVAKHEGVLAFPFRRYQIGKVYRAERAQAGRFREFYQCDIDVIGSNSPIVDAEFPAIINDIFDQFGFGEFTIRINNRLVLNGFFEGIGLEDVSVEVLRAIDKMEKITHEELVAEFESIGLSKKQIDQVIEFTEIAGTNDEILGKLAGLGVKSEVFSDGVAKLGALVAALRAMGVPEKRFQIDLRIARGLDYYTGTVYETVLNDLPGVGSVCSGGRYDDLAGYYTKTRQSLANIIVLPLDSEQVSYALEVASELRTTGLPVILYTETVSIKKKMKYADRMGCRYAVVIGEDEAIKRVLNVKDMTTGESSIVSVEELARLLKR